MQQKPKFVLDFEINLTAHKQTDVKKLKDAGIQTVAALTMHTRKVVFECLNLSRCV